VEGRDRGLIEETHHHSTTLQWRWKTTRKLFPEHAVTRLGFEENSGKKSQKHYQLSAGASIQIIGLITCSKTGDPQHIPVLILT